MVSGNRVREDVRELMRELMRMVALRLVCLALVNVSSALALTPAILYRYAAKLAPAP